MPRKVRFFMDDMPVHIVQRGHSRERVFFDDGDYAAYIYHLAQGCERYSVEVHSYCLMTNHVHLLLTPTVAGDASRLMQYLGRHYVPYINKKYSRTGTLWEGRFKASLVSSEEYLINVMRYIELNPVRAGMVASPEDYRWSSYKHNTGRLKIQLVTEHQVFEGLAATLEEAQRWYLDSFKVRPGEQATKAITAAWLTGTPLGGEAFQRAVERTLNRPVGLPRKGRPARSF